MIIVKAESMKKVLGLCFIYTSSIWGCQEQAGLRLSVFLSFLPLIQAAGLRT